MVRKMSKTESTKARTDGNTIEEHEANAQGRYACNDKTCPGFGKPGHFHEDVPPQAKTKLDEELSKAYAEFQADMRAIFGIDVSWKRYTVALVVGLAAAAGLGAWIMSITLAAAALTSSMFIGVVLILLGLILSALTGGVAAEFISRGIITKKFENAVAHSYRATSNFVSKLLKRSPAHA